MSRLDRWFEDSARGLARAAGRRSFLAWVGRLSVGVVGASVLPILPVARASGAPATLPDEVEGPRGDPTKCDYWRHCAIDGFLCACCGGSISSCPPGTELSKITWIGTCQNPVDGKGYIISYNDCCGKSTCGRCMCNRNEGDQPVYMPAKSNDIMWCQGTKTNSYHCTVAAVIGQALDD